MMIAALDDEHGVNEAGYRAMIEFAVENAIPTMDIHDAVEAVEGRFFLPEEHGIEA